MSATTASEPESETPENTSPEPGADSATSEGSSIGTGTSPRTESTERSARTTVAQPDSVPPSDPVTIGLTADDTVASRFHGDLPSPVTLSVPDDFSASQPAHSVPINPLPRLSRIPRIDPAGLPPAFDRVRFDTATDRDTSLTYALGSWLNALTTLTDDADKHLAAFLNTPAALTASSTRNAILTAIQEPGALATNTYDAWQANRREVQQGEQALWTWWTSTAPRCPDCGQGPKAHRFNETDCRNNPDDESWGYGPVDHSAMPTFDIAQTAQNPLDKAYRQSDSLTFHAPADVVDRLPALGTDTVELTFNATEDYPGPPTTAAYLKGWNAFTGKNVVHVNADAGPTMRVRDTVQAIAQAEFIPPTTTTTREAYPGRFADADAATAMILHLLNTTPGQNVDTREILGAWHPLSPTRLLSRLERITSLANAIRRKLGIRLP